MTDLKLAKLPDRTPIKVTVTISAELHLALKDYAALYEKAYGVAEPVVDLIPYMLEAFLQSEKRLGKGMRK